jgi:4-hydroxy-4-methyl-2-oxoglutarate aldolase
MDEDRLVERLAEFPVSMLADAAGSEGILPPAIVSRVPGTVMVGLAYTVKLPPGDNLGVHVAIERAAPGAVIVASAPWAHGAVWGAIASTAAREAGLAGFVTDGSVRDLQELARVGFPVFSRGISLHKTVKRNPGAHQVPLRFGSTVLHPGDVVAGDQDGVLVIPKHRAMEVLTTAQGVRAEEERVLKGLREGRSTVDLLGLGHQRREAGLSRLDPLRGGGSDDDR